jgi:hypothetical protein
MPFETSRDPFIERPKSEEEAPAWRKDFLAACLEKLDCGLLSSDFLTSMGFLVDG